ncbi:MAG: creatininase family protein [Byssovorax sp.]
MSAPARGSLRLADLATVDLRARMERGERLVALVPCGSVEPHGPHLPLGTDTLISERAALAAIPQLEARGLSPLLAPSIPYGVTRFAEGFAGAISVPAEALTALLRAVITGFLDAGFAHVCLINNHLEPAHDAAVRAALDGIPLGRASVACPLTRRWGRTLSAEFKSGACHAGRYETSLVLAASPALVDTAAASALPALDQSLSEGIKAGKQSFLSMGLTEAYTGAPALGTEAEGEALYALLATMIATEVDEALAKLAPQAM